MKNVIIAITSAFLVLTLLVSAVSSFVSGIGSFLFGNTDKTASEWEKLRKHVTEAFDKLNDDVGADLQKDVFEFVPSFSVELAKFALSEQKKYTYPVFYSGERETVIAAMEEVADELRSRFPYIDPDDKNARYYDEIYDYVNYRTLARDDEFCGGGSFDDYKSSTKNLLLKAAQQSHKLTVRKYSEDTYYENGKETLVKSFSVTDTDGHTKTVRLSVQKSSISIVRFLALNQAKLTLELSENADGFDADAAEINKDLDQNAPTVVNDSDEASEQKSDEDFQDKLNKIDEKAWDTNNENQKFFSTRNRKTLIKILKDNFKDGFFTAEPTTFIDGYGNSTLEYKIAAPSDEKLFAAFGVPLEYKNAVDEWEAVIKSALKRAEIDDSNAIFDVETALNVSLFARFGGLFKNPVETGNGVEYLSVMGQIDDYHRQNVNDGLVVGAQEDAAVGIALQRNFKCVTKVSAESKTDTSILLKYEINTADFQKDFGFNFGLLIGKEASEISKIEDLYIEFECLSDSQTNDEFKSKKMKVTDEISVGKVMSEHDFSGTKNSVHSGEIPAHTRIFAYLIDEQNDKYYIEPRLLFANIDNALRFAPINFTNSDSDGLFMYPLDKKWHVITTFFGYDPWRKGFHSGIDIGDNGIANATVYAAADGVVVKAYYDITRNSNKSDHGGYGNFVLIDHGNGLQTRYAHLSPDSVYKVEIGDKTEVGEPIGNVGSTGFATGYHLHFEVIVDGKAVNPLNFYESFP